MEFGLNLLRFEDIRSKVIEFLKNYTDADFDYDGENIRFFIDAISYVSMLMNYQLAMQANEYFIDTTTLRKNAVSIAKSLGYRPKRKIAARIHGKIYYYGSNFNENSRITIQPKNLFIGGDKGQLWTNMKPIVLEYYSNSILKGEFTLYQGEWQTYTYFANGKPFQSFVIIDPNVDENYFELYVKPTNAPDTQKVLWKEVKSFNQLLDKKIYFVEEDTEYEFCPRIIFGNGIIGEIPSRYDTVIVEYLRTEGANGNYETKIDFYDKEKLDVITSLDIEFNPDSFEIVIDEGSYSYGGYDNESLEEIKYYAPKFFYAAGRAVSKEDYKILLSKQKDIYELAVAGSDELFYYSESLSGKVFLTACPYLDLRNIFNNTKFYLLETDEIKIIDELKNIGVIAVLKSFVKPTYLVTSLKIDLEFNEGVVKKDELMNTIKDEILDYYQKEISHFGEDFRKSKIEVLIDSHDEIKSSDTDIDFYMIFSNDMFYSYKHNFQLLPVIKLRDETGNVIIDPSTNRPKTKPWLKFKEKALYGELYHPNLKRRIYNKLEHYENVLEFYELRPNVLVFKPNEFIDSKNIKRKISVIQSSQYVWNLYIDDRVIAHLSKYPGEGFRLTFNPLETEFTKELGFFPNQYSIEEVNGINVLKIKMISDVVDIVLEDKLNITLKINDDQVKFETPIKLVLEKEEIELEAKKENDDIVFKLNDETLFIVRGSTIHSKNYDLMDQLQWRDINVISKTENELKIQVVGTFNESVVGKLYYTNGIIHWNDEIDGINSRNERVKSSLQDVFNKYDIPYFNLIKLLPTEEDCKKIEEFDSQFSIFILPHIESIKAKVL